MTESFEKGYVSFADSDESSLFSELKQLMYENVYEGKVYNKVRDVHRAVFREAYNIVESLFPEIDTILALALMTDRDINTIGNYILDSKPVAEDIFSGWSFYELLDYIRIDRKIDYTDPMLNWERNIIVGKTGESSAIIQ